MGDSILGLTDYERGEEVGEGDIWKVREKEGLIVVAAYPFTDFQLLLRCRNKLFSISIPTVFI